MNKTLQRKLGLPLVTFEEVEQWMLKLMNDCKRENVLEHSSLRRWIEDFCWLLSPLL